MKTHLRSKAIKIILFLISVHPLVGAQTFPKENSKLNYRLVGFSSPPVPHTSKYIIEIAVGTYSVEATFKQNIKISLSVDSPRAIIKVPTFNTQYTWRINCMANSKGKISKGKFHYFSTGTLPSVDTSVNRLRVTIPAKQYKNAYVFVDATGVLYDMKGDPVWYLPPIDSGKYRALYRDLKLSPFGTITYLSGPTAYEITYDGNILWTKSGDEDKNKGINSFPCHHEFNRLSNGHYMVMRTEAMLCKFPHSESVNLIMVHDDDKKKRTDTSYKKTNQGILVEYDQKGNEVWSWEVSRYILQSDLRFLFDNSGRSLDLHDNSFFFDEQNKIIYISFKNINRIIKIKYPEGKVLNTYGKIFDRDIKAGEQMPPIPFDCDNGLFCLQHSVKVSQNGCIYIFDNGCNPEGYPKVLMMQQAGSGKDPLKIVWEYVCEDDSGPRKFVRQTSGGNVIELPDKSLFVSMDMQYGKMFIVNPEKQVLWSALPETRDMVKKTWHIQPSYRSSIITNPKDLEKLIWSSEK